MRVLLGWLSVASLLAHADAVLVDRIVAVVDLHAITRSAVEDRARPLLSVAKTNEQKAQARRDALGELIEEMLIAKEARRLGIEVSVDEVEAALAAVAHQNQISMTELVAETKRQGFDPDQYRMMLRRKLLELKWLNVRANRTALPEAEADRGAFFSSEKLRLLAELRASAAIEVRP